MLIIWILLALAAVVLLIAYICFRMAFYAKPRKPLPEDVIEIPDGEIYEGYRESMEKWAREVRAMPRQTFKIKSFDGLTLVGNFYEFAPGAPIELMFHGYRGSGERDLNGGVQRCFKLGRSALIVEQRCSAPSEGKVITFGIREHKDCLSWVDFAVQHFGKDVKLILTGISMGASTVLMAGGCDLPKNVIGILADCGYSSAKEIIQVVIRKMGLPVKLSYPFVRLGARLYGGFDLEQTSPVEMIQKCKVPVIFFHGESDDFVPCDMSRKTFEACPTRKMLVTIPDAGHGLSYLVGHETYMKAVREFFGEEGSATK